MIYIIFFLFLPCLVKLVKSNEILFTVLVFTCTLLMKPKLRNQS